MRLPFNVTVEGVGDFTFKHETFIENVGIMARGRRILGGDCDNQELMGWALMIARLEALTEKAPEGWNLADLDPMDEEAVNTILLVHARLRDEQTRFRAEHPAKRLQAGKGTGQDGGVRVPAPVQPASD